VGRKSPRKDKRLPRTNSKGEAQLKVAQETPRTKHQREKSMCKERRPEGEEPRACSITGVINSRRAQAKTGRFLCEAAAKLTKVDRNAEEIPLASQEREKRSRGKGEGRRAGKPNERPAHRSTRPTSGETGRAAGERLTRNCQSTCRGKRGEKREKPLASEAAGVTGQNSRDYRKT